MEKLIEVLRALADGVRGPLVHDLISELEAAAAAPEAVPGPPAEGKAP